MDYKLLLVDSIDNLSHLSEIKKELVGHIAIDTEFRRSEKTHHQFQLSLIQLCYHDCTNTKKVIIIDFFTIKKAFEQIITSQEASLNTLRGVLTDSFQDLYAILENPEIIKVFYSCSQDIDFLFHELQIKLHDIFDIQLADLFCDAKKQALNYEKTIKKYLNIEVQRDLSISYKKWLIRPLPIEYIQYAITDVTLLYDVYSVVQRILQQSNKLSWYNEEIRSILEKYYASNELINIFCDYCQKYLKINIAEYAEKLAAQYLSSKDIKFQKNDNQTEKNNQIERNLIETNLNIAANKYTNISADVCASTKAPINQNPSDLPKATDYQVDSNLNISLNLSLDTDSDLNVDLSTLVKSIDINESPDIDEVSRVDISFLQNTNLLHMEIALRILRWRKELALECCTTGRALLATEDIYNIVDYIVKHYKYLSLLDTEFFLQNITSFLKNICMANKILERLTLVIGQITSNLEYFECLEMIDTLNNKNNEENNIINNNDNNCIYNNDSVDNQPNSLNDKSKLAIKRKQKAKMLRHCYQNSKKPNSTPSLNSNIYENTELYKVKQDSKKQSIFDEEMMIALLKLGLQNIAIQYNISDILLFNTNDIRLFLLKNKRSRLKYGWRQIICNDTLNALLDGSAAVGKNGISFLNKQNTYNNNKRA